MRKILLGTVAILIAQLLQAQNKIEPYGKISKEDLEMKTCDFDPDASAYCLIDAGEVHYEVNRFSINIVTRFRRRIKILKEEGNKRADIKIHYYSKDNYEQVSNISGIVYNLDASGNIITTKLEKSLIYDKKVDDKYSEISFAMPDVKPGSVIEYKYETSKKNYSDIDDWYFQEDIPVRYSGYNLIIPEYFVFSYKVIRRQPMEKFSGKRTEDGDWFVMRNIPSLKDEPYMSGYRDYLQRVDFQLAAINVPGESTISYTTTWDKLSEELTESEAFGKQLRRNVSGTSALKTLLKDEKDDRKKMDIIYKFVQSNMSWNGNYARASYDGVKEAWDKKSGSVADINLLLVNLLKDNDVKAAPLLVSTRDNGRVNTLLPFLGQFNATYACAEANGQTFILNAADKYNPSSLIPYEVQFTDAFLVDRKNSRVINIEDLDKKLQHNVSLFMNIEKNGNVSGWASVASSDYGRNIRLKTYRDKDMKKFFSENEGIKLNVDSFNVTNDAVDTLPLMQKIYFNGTMQNSDDYSFLPYNLFSGIAKNPFIAEKRESDIDFGFKQSYSITGTYMVPEEFTVEELPKNIRMILPDTSIAVSRMSQYQNGVINFRVSVDFMRPQYLVEEYPGVKEVYKKIFALLNEQIVLKKKKV